MKSQAFIELLMKRTPPLPLSFLLDINSPIMWVNCEEEYTSSTYLAPRCHSKTCAKAGASSCFSCARPTRPGCHNNTCELMVTCPLTRQRAPCELAQDVLSIPLSQGLHGQLATIEQYTFACASSRLIQPGYPKGIRGVVGFGPTPLSFPYQLASSLGHRRAFCLCLAASSQETGALFFGTVPTSIPLVGETKLIISRQSEYSIGVRSLSISGQSIQLPSLLGIQEGVVQTRISTTERYLILHSSILKVVTQSFVSQLQGVRQVQAIAPFGVCFDHESIRSRKVLPNIDLVLHGENVVWSLVGANLLVSPQPGVACLVAVDGGVRLQAPIVLGVHPLQNYLLHFDLEASTLRFSRSLLLGGRTCFGHRHRRMGHKQACKLMIRNAFTKMASVGNLSEDTISLQSTNGLNPRSTVSTQFLFVSAPENLSQGLASHARGVAGLGQSMLALPTQLSAAFNFSRKFAVCLPPSTYSNGVIFFGDGPYAMLPGIDISKILIYTPLVVPSTKDHYFIHVKSIEVNGNRVPLDSSLLHINGRGKGGTMISTTEPYSILESSIYKSFASVFIKEAKAMNISLVARVAPFEVCFSTKPRDEFPYRPAMPTIDLVLQTKEVFWRIFETNSMVPVSEDVTCLGFLDGGSNPKASIVIGGHLLEDNLLQFDLESSRLGFTSTLLLRGTSCTSFNFTSIP
ncbi:hypothetical protein Ancab_000765 [Ancistrocladus abbreviatus]